MIFLNDEIKAGILRRLAFDGRDYMLGANQDEDIMIGHHFNMTPDTAAQVMLKYNTLSEKEYSKSSGGSWMYRDLRSMECFKKYVSNGDSITS